jgi:hypothetical protein
MKQESNKKPKTTSASAQAHVDILDLDIDWTAVFPTARIKTILQKEPSIGRLPKESLEMIGASSALFLKQLFKAARAQDTAAVQTDDNDNAHDQKGSSASRPIVITAAHISRAVKANESWHLFATALEEEGELLATTTVTAAAGEKRKRKPAPKTRPQEEVSKSVDPALDEALQLAALESTAATTNEKEIVADEEDYDS